MTEEPLQTCSNDVGMKQDIEMNQAIGTCASPTKVEDIASATHTRDNCDSGTDMRIAMQMLAGAHV